MSDLALVAALESRLVNAWPSFEVEVAEGWLLRFAEGHSKRANSATAFVPGANLTPDLVRHVSETFASRGIPPCFRLVGMEAPGTEGVLRDLGFVPFEPSLAMAAPVPGEGAVDPSVAVAAAAKPRWIEGVAVASGATKAKAEVLGRILRRIRQPAGFATFSLDGDEVGWGFAVAERGYVGLYDLVVTPRLHGLGIGRRLVSSLLAWGRNAGASRAYLQVTEANAVAEHLYRSLGFVPAYTYRHLVQPGAFRLAEDATTTPAVTKAAAPASARNGSA